jgi:hypothetical protein
MDLERDVIIQKLLRKRQEFMRLRTTLADIEAEMWADLLAQAGVPRGEDELEDMEEDPLLLTDEDFLVEDA